MDCCFALRLQTAKIFSKTETPKQQQPQPWAPVDAEINPKRELKLTQRMQNSIKRLESSQFYNSFLDQIQMMDSFPRVLGSELMMQVLSLAILVKRRFSWIGNMEAFDPVLSATECRVLEALGYTVLMVNEHG
ncbi:SRR1-like domain [Dillenia turbinata]|uniref:SRR1-like domain n=1 Tax=Dillenia turbinata TaxID=194707 RepID=A0AAN8ZGZ0_9MAGN